MRISILIPQSITLKHCIVIDTYEAMQHKAWYDNIYLVVELLEWEFAGGDLRHFIIQRFDRGL